LGYHTFRGGIPRNFYKQEERWKSFYVDQIISPIKDEEGKITNFVSTARDITSMREIEEKMRKIIDYDPLTNLPRRDRFLRELETTIKEKRDSTIVIFLMDIHNFSAVNALYGYEFGDKVLRFFAERLRTLPGFWARYGDDAFIGFKELDSKGELYNLLKDIFKVGELKLEDFSYRLGFHVGVSIYPDDANNAQDLLHAVEIALRNAQKKAPGSFELYNEEEKEKLLERLKLAEELRRALEKGEFLVHFQPIYSSLDLKPVMAEALLRWNSERFGFLEASSFINILEETELIVDVGYYVFEQCVSVIKQYNLEIPISINLSPVQIKREDLPDRLFEITMGVPAERILLEITEGVIIEDLQKAYKLLKVLKERGFSIVLDDFGVKYSSLSYLTKLPIDYIKIDMSFTKEVDSDEKVLNVVKAIVAIANTLGLKTVVEGIERPSQLDILRKVGCHYLQGFYLGKPMEIRDFLKLLLS
jgi:diguanylate cyclase (GGDEF)-like protein